MSSPTQGFTPHGYPPVCLRGYMANGSFHGDLLSDHKTTIVSLTHPMNADIETAKYTNHRKMISRQAVKSAKSVGCASHTNSFLSSHAKTLGRRENALGRVGLAPPIFYVIPAKAGIQVFSPRRTRRPRRTARRIIRHGFRPDPCSSSTDYADFRRFNRKSQIINRKPLARPARIWHNSPQRHTLTKLRQTRVTARRGPDRCGEDEMSSLAMKV